MANPNDRQTIHSLRLSIKEALELISNVDDMRVGQAAAILEAAHEYTDPKLLDKDCGCG